MLVGRVLANVGLINIIGPDRVESGRIARHAGHEGGHQGAKPQTQQTGREILVKHHRDDQVIVKLHDRLASLIQNRLPIPLFLENDFAFLATFAGRYHVFNLRRYQSTTAQSRQLLHARRPVLDQPLGQLRVALLDLERDG